MELQEELTKAYEQIAALKARVQRKNVLTLKVSPKGAISVYGLGRWPVTLYTTQWDRLLSEADGIKQFAVDNAGVLATKPSNGESE